MDSSNSNSLRADLVTNWAFVQRLALALARDANVADDLTQDVMRTALERAPEIEPKTIEALRAWLSTVTRRLAIDRVRSESARRVRERTASRPEVDERDNALVERVARSQRVIEAVMQLEEPHRSTVLLRYLEELPIDEVARRTNVSETAVRKRLEVGLRALRSKLDDEFGEDASVWSAALIVTRTSHSALVASTSVGVFAALQGLMVMNAKWIAAAVVAVLIGLVFWLRSAEPLAPSLAGPSTHVAEIQTGNSERSKRASSERAAIEVASTSAPIVDNPAESSVFLIVRSSVGLTFPFAELQTSDGDWIQADLDNDRCTIDAQITLPCQVRAPGHVAKLAKKANDLLLLDPDALFTLEAEGLRQRTKLVRVFDPFAAVVDPYSAVWPIRPELQRACASGFRSDDVWLVAVSHDLIQDASADQELDVEVHWPNLHRADAEFKVAEGVRATWKVPCGDPEGVAPLRIHIDRSSAESSSDLELCLRCPSLAESDIAVEYFPWGRVVDYQRSLSASYHRVLAGESELQFDEIPLGVRVLIAVRDETTGAYARDVFVHDGNARTLKFHTGFTLKARLVAADDDEPVKMTDVTWELHDVTGRTDFWRVQKQHLLASATGTLEVHGPVREPRSEQDRLDPPARLTLRIDAPGFESFTRDFDTAGATRFDCGDLRLTRRPAQIMLSPGHSLLPAAIEWMPLRMSAKPETNWRIRSAASLDDGSLGLYMLKSEAIDDPHTRFQGSDVRTGEQIELQWPSDTSDWIAIHVLLGDRDEDWLFEWQNDGRYAAEQRVERDIKLECESMPVVDGQWKVGWQRRDAWGTFAALAPSRVGDVKRMRVAAPAGSTFWWSLAGTPPGVLGAPVDIGGSVPFDALQRKFVLR